MYYDEDDVLTYAFERSKTLRPSQSKTFDLQTIAFDKQREFIQNDSRLKALFCTRRASKSYTGGLYMVSEGMKTPQVNCLYIGLTRLSAKGILWKDVLKDIDHRHNLNMHFNGTELTATLPNGSMMWLTGADADEDEMEKLLGKKYKLIIIDEAASFNVDLRRMVYGILKPATADQRGTICLMGTSGNLTQGLFFDVTKGIEPGWKLFEWSAHDNPHVAKQWQEELDEIKRDRPLFMETPLFKQWYLNEWVIDTEKLVYRFAYGRNEYTTLPQAVQRGWNYILGVDLGYDPDPSAFIVAAFHEHIPCLYFIDGFKQKEMDITDVANKIKWFKTEYGIEKVIIDGSNKQAVMEMQKRHELPLQNADKREKTDFIQIMNAEFIQGKIKLNPHMPSLNTGPKDLNLSDEYLNLIWDEKKLLSSGKREEHPNCENHLADAALYAWRHCYQFLSKAPTQAPNLRVREQYINHTKKLLDEALERQIEHEESRERGDDIFAISEMGMDENPLSYYLNKKRGRG
jgi:hypothetical protein